MPQAWGGAEVGLGGGLRFVVPVRTINAGPNPRYLDAGHQEAGHPAGRLLGASGPTHERLRPPQLSTTSSKLTSKGPAGELRGVDLEVVHARLVT